MMETVPEAFANICMQTPPRSRNQRHVEPFTSPMRKTSMSTAGKSAASPLYRRSNRGATFREAEFASPSVATEKKIVSMHTHASSQKFTRRGTLSTPVSAIKKSSSKSERRLNRCTSSPSPSLSSADRFIPNRSFLRMDLCRASLVSAEKRRKDSLKREENSDPNSRDVLTPLQSEFRRRMRGALLSLPVDNLGGSRASNTGTLSRERQRQEGEGSPGRNSDNGNSGPVSTSLIYTSHITSLSDQDPAYRAAPEPDTNDAKDDLGPGGLGRMLTFREDYYQSPTVVPSKKAKNDSFITPKQLKFNRARHASSPAILSDPFTHDQLRVLHRSASGGVVSTGDSTMDPMSLADAGLRSVAKKVGRRIPTAPSRILDAPELVDDYYLNLLSWGADNILAVALGQSVYLWYADTEEIDHLLTLSGPDDFVTSVSWCMDQGNTHYIAVGTNDSPVQIWDASTLQMVRRLGGHSARVGSLSWNQNWLSSGSRDSLILQHDIRSRNHVVSTYVGHTQEVCGLKWNDDGTTLASGGNENYLCLWDAAMSRQNSNTTTTNTVSPRLLLTQHQAAVKALAWCPFHRGILASGGGTADRTIKFWNSNSGAMLNSVDTGSQVCSLLWSKHNKELCSSHGFSENQLILWKYPTMTKIQEFTGHQARVLHMEQSPDGACVVSAAADETLRFWDVFGSAPNSRKQKCMAMGDFTGGKCSSGGQNVSLHMSLDLLQAAGSNKRHGHGRFHGDVFIRRSSLKRRLFKTLKHPTITKLMILRGLTTTMYYNIASKSTDGAYVLPAAADERHRVLDVFRSTSSSRKQNRRGRVPYPSLIEVTHCCFSPDAAKKYSEDELS